MCYNLFGISFVSYFGFHSGFHSVDDEEIGSEGGEDEGWVGKESHPPNPPVGGILSLSLSLCIWHHYTSPTASVGSFSAQPALKHKNLMFCPALTSIVSSLFWHNQPYDHMTSNQIFIHGGSQIYLWTNKYIFCSSQIYLWSIRYMLSVYGSF